MGFGKFVKKLTKGVGKAGVGAGIGYLTGGPAGAAAGLAASQIKSQKRVAPTGYASNYMGGTRGVNPIMTGFGQYGTPQRAPGSLTVSNYDVVPVGNAMTVPSDITDTIYRMIGALGIPLKPTTNIVRLGRKLLAKLMNFARRNPGMTILALLANLGIVAEEANRLIAWWTTSGRKRRRMRVANVKALNRSVRRLEGFARLATRVQGALAQRATRRGYGRTTSRRCFKCHKNPCGC